MEIDAGFEGEDTFAIVEAKNEAVTDFHVRQLYYPYRAWLERTGKRIVPVFLSYSNASSVFTLHVFRFNEPRLYNSIELVEQRKFQVVPSGIQRETIVEAVGRARVQPEPAGIPFPQADSFERIVDLLAQLYGAGGTLSKDYVTSNYDFDERQTQYYAQAAAYLGLVERRRSEGQGVTYSLTRRGASVMSRHPQTRNLALVECMLERGVLNRALRIYFENGRRPSSEQVEEIMRGARLGLSGKTIPRRAQTVLRWVDWVATLAEAGVGLKR